MSVIRLQEKTEVFQNEKCEMEREKLKQNILPSKWDDYFDGTPYFKSSMSLRHSLTSCIWISLPPPLQLSCWQVRKEENVFT